MGRKRALLLLIAVVLWTAMPALACFTPASQPACCHGMMQGCDDSAASMEGMACCQVRPSDSTVPPFTAAPSHFTVSMTQLVAWAGAVPVTASGSALTLPGAAPSPPPQSGYSSILRI